MLPLSVSQAASLLGQAEKNEALIFSVAQDSRKVRPGSLFFALKGQNNDGHDFLETVRGKGAVAAIVSSTYEGPSFGLSLIRVPDVLRALQYLAHLAVLANRPKIVAITGSLGKTTTKDFLAELLKSRFSVYSDPGNANSQVGLALSLLSMRGDEEVAVVEMGMSERGHIENLVKMAPPDIAIVTTVALVHAMNFSGLEEIARAKAEIFGHPETTLGLYSLDTPHETTLKESGSCEKVSFSLKDRHAPFFAEEEEGRVTFYEEGILKISLPFPLLGKHNIHNLLASAAAARKLGLTWEDIAHALPQLKLPQGRLQLLPKGPLLFLSDAYNANKDSICSALETLASLRGGRKIAVLSEMLELGSFSPAEHEVVGRSALETVDCLYCIGPGALGIKAIFDLAGKPCFYYEKREDLCEALKKDLRPEDIVLLKGARAYKLNEIVEQY